MGHFAPDDFTVSLPNQEWAMKEFKIDRHEVFRQTELMIDHEFKRNYTDWQRVFRNWMRKAEEIGTLKREFKHRNPHIVSDEQKKKDAELATEFMERLAKRDG
jgi:hypothetical protein